MKKADFKRLVLAALIALAIILHIAVKKDVQPKETAPTEESKTEASIIILEHELLKEGGAVNVY